MRFKIYSPKFENLGRIPAKYTARGQNVSPPLEWTGIPPGTKSLALVVEEPDEPGTDATSESQVHWIVYNLPPESNGLPEGVAVNALPSEAEEGLNSWKQVGYRGPAPRAGDRTYLHTLYALNVVLPELDAPSRIRLRVEIEDHVIDRAVLIGICGEM